MMVDEADVDLVGAGSGSSSPRSGSKRALDSGPARRKPGPLPRHICASPRPRSPSPAPPSPIISIVETPPILLPNGGETGLIRFYLLEPNHYLNVVMNKLKNIDN